MGYVYNVYGNKEVEEARKLYNNVAMSAPKYSDSAATINARQQADNYSQKYQNQVLQ